jgi:TonB family protein
MPFSKLGNRPHRAKFAILFIAITMIHVRVIQFVWSPQKNSLVYRENINFLESFTFHAENSIQTEDAIQSKDIDLAKTTVATQHATPQPPQPDGIKISKDSISNQTKPSYTRRHPSSIRHKTDDTQTGVTPPTALANVLSNPPPPYPRQSRRLGEQGKVVVAAEIATSGKALQAFVNITSGYPRLDHAALESVKKWQFIPGKKAGVSQKMWVNIPINFILE